MKRTGIFILAAMAISLAILTAGCGGGGGGDTTQSTTTPPGSSGPSLAWNPPSTFSDNSALDPYQQLNFYEIYLRTDNNFSDNDDPVAQVAAVANVVGPDGKTSLPTLTTIFDLDNLAPFVGNGKVYYLSIKSVGVDGLKSAFSVPAVWNRS